MSHLPKLKKKLAQQAYIPPPPINSPHYSPASIEDVRSMYPSPQSSPMDRNWNSEQQRRDEEKALEYERTLRIRDDRGVHQRSHSRGKGDNTRFPFNALPREFGALSCRVILTGIPYILLGMAIGLVLIGMINWLSTSPLSPSSSVSDKSVRVPLAVVEKVPDEMLDDGYVYQPPPPPTVAPVTINPLNKDVRQQVCQLLHDVESSFRELEIPYVIDRQLLLAATKHNGLLNWEDTYSFQIPELPRDKIMELRKYLRNYRIRTHMDPVTRLRLSNARGERVGLKWRYPWISIYSLTRHGMRYIYEEENARASWSDNCYYMISELDTLVRWKVGSLHMMGPKDPEPYLKRCYGEDYRQFKWKESEDEKGTFVKIDGGQDNTVEMCEGIEDRGISKEPQTLFNRM